LLFAFASAQFSYSRYFVNVIWNECVVVPFIGLRIIHVIKIINST